MSSNSLVVSGLDGAKQRLPYMPSAMSVEKYSSVLDGFGATGQVIRFCTFALLKFITLLITGVLLVSGEEVTVKLPLPAEPDG
jgi:hypothetical protein